MALATQSRVYGSEKISQSHTNNRISQSDVGLSAIHISHRPPKPKHTRDPAAAARRVPGRPMDDSKADDGETDTVVYEQPDEVDDTTTG
jgi:hypothetical protein